MRNLIYAMFTIAFFVIAGCGDETKQVKETDLSCAGQSCESDSDCSCDANFCMPEEISAMPNVGPVNAGRCTLLDCDVEDNSTCPEGYECWALSMGKDYFPEGTESVCMKIPEETDDDTEEADDTVNDEDVDSVMPDESSDESIDTENPDSLVDDGEETDDEVVANPDSDSIETDSAPDEDNAELWPACYDQACKSSDECCEGTKCLNKMAEMDPNITESEYCVVSDCTEGDDTTCPPNHTCYGSMMGSYCIKK